MTHFWQSGDPIRVVANEEGMPGRITWRGRAHPVERIHSHWRLDAEWWRRRIWWDCFDLSTTTGLEGVVYRDLVTGDWYLQRLYD